MKIWMAAAAGLAVAAISLSAPAWADRLQDLGSTCLSRDNPPEARLEACWTVLDEYDLTRESEFKVWDALTWLNDETGRFAEAVETATAALELFEGGADDRARLTARRATARIESGDVRTGRQELYTLRAGDHGIGLIDLGLGMSFIAEGRYGEALDFIGELRDPEIRMWMGYETLYWHGRALYGLGQAERAFESFQEALYDALETRTFLGGTKNTSAFWKERIASAAYEAVQTWAEESERRRDYRTAETALGKALDLHWELFGHPPAELYFRRAVALDRQEKFEQAIEDLWVVIRRDPDHAAAHNQLGWIYATGPSDVMHPAGAVEHAVKAVRLKEKADYLDTLGAAYLLNYNEEKATDAYYRAMRLDAGYAERALRFLSAHGYYDGPFSGTPKREAYDAIRRMTGDGRAMHIDEPILE
jgi:tetratricopeptide (TPR) repeat protein